MLTFFPEFETSTEDEDVDVIFLIDASNSMKVRECLYVIRAEKNVHICVVIECHKVGSFKFTFFIHKWL